MNLEQEIEKVLSVKLEDGTVNKLIGEQFEKGIQNALEHLSRSYGDITKIIEEQIKSVMVPYLESYDYSKYIVKLDSVLTDVLKNSAVENKKLLENFKDLMDVSDKEKEINVSELFEIWKKYVAKNVKTDDLEIDYDDGVRYQSVEVKYKTEYDEDRDWSSFKYATLVFECEHDNEMNFALRLSKWNGNKKEGWSIRFDNNHDISSLRNLNSFEILLMKLNQNGTKLIMDDDYDSDEVQSEKEPEASFS